MAKDVNKLPDIISELKKIQKSRIIAGVLAPDDSEQAIIAGANEFGASFIVSEKMRKAIMAKLLDAGRKDLIKMIPAIGSVINIPERSFITHTFKDPTAIDNLFKFISFGIDQIIAGKGDAEKTMKAGLSSMVSSIQKRITDDIEPSNHPITVAIKGSTGTLRDTGRLVQSISGRVEGAVSISV